MERSLRKDSKREATEHVGKIERFLSVSVKSTASEVMNILPRQASVRMV